MFASKTIFNEILLNLNPGEGISSYIQHILDVPSFRGRNLRKIQILGVKLETDPKFLGTVLRKT